jgi:hypothetical protein
MTYSIGSGVEKLQRPHGAIPRLPNALWETAIRDVGDVVPLIRLTAGVTRYLVPSDAQSLIAWLREIRQFRFNVVLCECSRGHVLEAEATRALIA